MDSINEALAILRAQGHLVETNPGACVVGGAMHVPIDGHLRSERELHEMVTPADKDVYGFESHGKQYEIHIYFYFLCSEITYEMYQDGTRLGERRPLPLDDNPLEFVLRTTESRNR